MYHNYNSYCVALQCRCTFSYLAAEEEMKILKFFFLYVALRINSLKYLKDSASALSLGTVYTFSFWNCLVLNRHESVFL